MTRIIKIIPLALFLAVSQVQSAVATTGSEWRQVSHDAQRSNYNPAETVIGSSNADALTKSWVSKIDTADPHEVTDGAPLIADGMVLFSSGIFGCFCGHIYAADPTTGKRLWTFTASNGMPVLEAAANGMLYVSYCCAFENGLGNWGQIYDVSTAGLKLVTTSSFGLDQGFVYSGGTLYGTWSDPDAIESGCSLGARAYYLMAYDATDATLLWSKHPTAMHACRYWTPPVVSNGLVFTSQGSSPSMTLEAYAASTGDLMWARKDGGTPVAEDKADGLVYSTCGSSLCAHSLDGTLDWSKPNVTAPIVVASSTVYAVCGAQGTSVCAYDATTGTRVWRTGTGSVKEMTGANKAIFTVSRTGLVSVPGSVTALDASTGAWLSTIGTSFREAVIAGGTVLLTQHLGIKALVPYRPL